MRDEEREFRRRAQEALRDPEAFSERIGEWLPEGEESAQLASQWLVELAEVRWDERLRPAALSLAGELLDRGANPNHLDARERYGEGWELALSMRRSALMIACLRGEMGLVKLLLDRGANPDEENGSGEFALGFACGAPDPVLVCEALLAAGASVEGPSPGRRRVALSLSPLCIAVKLGRLDLTELFLRRGASAELQGPGGDAHATAIRYGREGFARAAVERLGLEGELREEGAGEAGGGGKGRGRL